MVNKWILRLRKYARIALLGSVLLANYAHAQSVSAPDNIDGNPESFETVPSVSVINLTGTIRVTVNVDSGNIQIGTETTAPLSAPQGYMAADWTSDSADEISFEGTLANVNAALGTLAYRGFGGTLTTTASTAGSAYYSGTGRFYEYVASGDIDWDDARDAAAARTLNGQTGYLATITTEGEMDFIVEKIGGTSPAWISGDDASVEGEWRYSTGPEAGTQFWQGTSSGNTVGGAFEDWCDGEPNNSGGEDYLQITFDTIGGEVSDGCWNDLPNEGASNAQYNPVGYVTEYAAASALVASTNIVDVAPTLQLITRNTPAGEYIPYSTFQNCGTTFVFNVAFSESVSGVGTADFELSGAGSTGMSISTVSASSGTNFTVTVTCPDNANRGAVNLNVSSSATIIDSNGSNLTSNPSAAIQGYILTDRPSLSSVTRISPLARTIPSANTQTCLKPQLQADFSKDVQNVTANDFDITGTAATGVSIETVVQQSASRYLITLDCLPSTNLGTLALALSSGNDIEDLTSLALASTTIGSNEDFEITTDQPLLSSVTRVMPLARVIPTTDTQSCLKPELQANFSKDVQNVSAADFDFTGSAATGVSIETVTQQTASRYRITLACLPSGNTGTLALALSSSNDIADIYGLALASTTIGSNDDFEITNEPQLAGILRDAPADQEIPARDLGTCIAPRFRINFSEPVQNVDAADFALSGEGATDLTIETVASLTSASFTVTLSCIPSNNRGTISLNLNSTVTIVDSLDVPLDADAVASSESYTITEDRMASAEDPSVDEIVEANAEAPVVAVEKQLTHIKERLSEQRATPTAPEPGPVGPQQAPLTPTRRAEMVATRLNQLTTYFQQTENGNVYFDTASSDLSTAARITLARQAQQLKRYNSAVYMIEGHTDKRGSIGYNQKLGTTRAQAVRNYFIEQGISEDRVQIVSFGEEKPVSACDSEDCFKLNRRAQTRLVINEAVQQEIGAEIDAEHGAPLTLDDRTSRSSCGLIASLSLSNDTGTMQDTRPVLCDSTEALADGLGHNWGVWTQGLISIGIVQNGNDGPEMDFTGQNLTFGIDYRFPTNTIIGFALGSGQNDLKGETASKSETEQIVASFYMAQPIGKHWAVNLSGGHVIAETQSTRVDSETGDILTGQRDGASDFASAEMVYYLRRDEASLDLSFGYTYMRSRFDVYNESGSAALSFAPQEIINESATLGAKWNFAPAEGQSAWRYNVKAGAQYDLSDDSVAKVNFVNIPSETDYLIVSRNDEPLTLSIGGGAEWSRPRGDQLTLDYNYQQNAQLSRIHSLALTYRKPF